MNIDNIAENTLVFHLLNAYWLLKLWHGKISLKIKHRLITFLYFSFPFSVFCFLRDTNLIVSMLRSSDVAMASTTV